MKYVYYAVETAPGRFYWSDVFEDTVDIPSWHLGPYSRFSLAEARYHCRRERECRGVAKTARFPRVIKVTVMDEPVLKAKSRRRTP